MNWIGPFASIAILLVVGLSLWFTRPGRLSKQEKHFIVEMQKEARKRNLRKEDADKFFFENFDTYKYLYSAQFGSCLVNNVPLVRERFTETYTP